MTPLRFDDVTRALPDLAELRPVLDHLLATSTPDPSRRWTGSSELETAGARLVDSGRWAEAARDLAAREGAHLGAVYRCVLEAVTRIQRGDAAAGAEALLEAAALEESRDRGARAAAYAASAVGVARGGADAKVLATALRRQARGERAAGRLPEAERRYAEGHELARDAGDVAGAAEGAVGVGNVLTEQGRWAEAETWYRKALDLTDTGGAPTPELWHALLNLHVVTRSLGQVDESVEWLKRAERVAAALADPAAPALVHNAWGQLEMARGAFEAACARFREALSAPAGAWARVNFRLNLGEALLAGGRTLDAAEETREAEREAIGAGVTSKLPEVYRLLGRIASARGNADAIVLFERALSIVHERGLPPLEEAVTLQAYARELRDTEPERAEALHERALGLYRDLGIPGMRAPWAETFGAARDPSGQEMADGNGRPERQPGEDHEA